LTPDERLSEVAAILAAGILRLHARAALAGADAARKETSDSPASCLDVSAETALSVQRG
jgi:hypothetical protein